MRGAVILVALGLAWAPSAGAQAVPSGLTALASKARLDGSVAAWCRGMFRVGAAESFAVAVTSASGGGRYLVLDADGTATELAPFARTPDLSCYERSEAEALNVTISRSDTVRGGVAPRWGTSFVCAFTDDTTAVCWQYSPADRAYVVVGRWVT